ncbi:uncharacterized protein LOC132314261 [Cornus florida]|uniref:uncharacterized protein LOC132314261 n=1 Tax=Cornus florida TaxID=4283 RepID=UPI002899579B|nr:uncharacterized protein LOC132314261 [Cornus florida]
MHDQAIQFVKQVCVEAAKLDFPKANGIIGPSILVATTFGISEVVEEIPTVFPEAIYVKNEMNQNVFHVAIANRHKNVFNLIYQFHDEFIGQINLSSQDLTGNSGLDLVSCLNSEQELNLRGDAAGATLQLQPLVVTIVFAADITVPGGSNDNNGLPKLSKDKAFPIFIISDALALYSSTSSLLIFSSILTSRNVEVDFLHALPKRLIDGLITLFSSIISTMIAFGATLYLEFGHNKAWILVPVIVFSCIPVTLFMSSQFPLLLDMIESSYGHSVFGQKSDRILY